VEVLEVSDDVFDELKAPLSFKVLYVLFPELSCVSVRCEASESFLEDRCCVPLPEIFQSCEVVELAFTVVTR
jgi:hypothetical protein